ncbi:MAG: M50 family metallopeptidase [Candidatus Gracilibacteria bacterium]|nr:M50 family metallopeptidase [Candidatus Gracilibacteria bacterium]
MDIVFGILLTFFIFLVVVLIHELGHFLTARMTGMRVLEFGFGIPPKVFRLFTDKKGTEYTFNALPIGGFVRIKGEDPGSPESSDADSFAAKSWWARALVLIAGVTMNFLLAIVILFGFFFIGTEPIAPNFLVEKDYNSLLLPSPKKAIDTGYLVYSGIELTPLTGSVAEKSGIISGDVVVSVNGMKITHPQELIDAIKKNTTVALVLSGTGGERNVNLTPENGKVGMYIGYSNLDVNRNYKEKYGAVESLQNAVQETYVLSYMTVDVLGKTLKNLIVPKTPADREEAKGMIAGPIGMGAGMVEMVDIGITIRMILLIIAMISINLGVINILPFPALDGGRLLSTTIASLLSFFVVGKNRMAQIEAYIHTFGMILLLGLSLLIAFFDVSKFF